MTATTEFLESPTPEQEVAILAEAERLMGVPHAIVDEYIDFAEDADGFAVPVGDPAACRFCVSGVVDHAAHVLYGARLDPDDERSLLGESGIDAFDRIWNRYAETGAELTDEQREGVRRDVQAFLRSRRELIEVGTDDPEHPLGTDDPDTRRFVIRIDTGVGQDGEVQDGPSASEVEYLLENALETKLRARVLVEVEEALA